MDDALITMLRFATKGFSCSQIMLLLALDQTGSENPGLIRAMAGLAYGCGSTNATCGVLTGACCILGYFAGKGKKDETASDKLPLMLEEVNDWFQEEYGQKYQGITCHSIVGERGPDASRNTCGAILSATFTQTMKILSQHNVRIECRD